MSEQVSMGEIIALIRQMQECITDDQPSDRSKHGVRSAAITAAERLVARLSPRRGAQFYEIDFGPYGPPKLWAEPVKDHFDRRGRPIPMIICAEITPSARVEMPPEVARWFHKELGDLLDRRGC